MNSPETLRSRDQITRDLAYEKWEEAGSPESCPDHFWFAAENQLVCENCDDIKNRLENETPIEWVDE
jgi:hypothetical protein